MDSTDGNRKIDKEEFYWGLKDNGTNISRRESEILLDYLDTNQDGYVNFDEFLVGLRGKPNEIRQDIINKAFHKFDKDGSGVVNSADLQGVFNCDLHPKVQNGEMTVDEVFTQFLAQFGDKNGDGMITKSEWDDYYAAVSSNVDNDDHFVDIIRAAWKL